MKVNEMTNQQLAKELVEPIPAGSHLRRSDVLREAAARLRRPSPVDDDLLKMARDIDKLRAKFKVAEDALTELQARCVASVYDGTLDPYEALKIAEDALAAIREPVTDRNRPEGGEDGK